MLANYVENCSVKRKRCKSKKGPKHEKQKGRPHDSSGYETDKQVGIMVSVTETDANFHTL